MYRRKSKYLSIPENKGHKAQRVPVFVIFQELTGTQTFSDSKYTFNKTLYHSTKNSEINAAFLSLDHFYISTKSNFLKETYFALKRNNTSYSC